MRRVKKRKGTEVQRVKAPSKSWADDALIGEKEQKGKQRRKKKEREMRYKPIKEKKRKKMA